MRNVIKPICNTLTIIALALFSQAHASAKDQLELQSCLNAEFANVLKKAPNNLSNEERFKLGYSKGFDFIDPYEKELRALSQPQETVPRMLEVASAAAIRMAENLSQAQIDQKLLSCRSVRQTQSVETSKEGGERTGARKNGMESVVAVRFPRELLGLLEPKKTATSKSCRVQDVDLSDSYFGECQKGMASGHGVARGRDEYVGQFASGQLHGFGKYRWGANSKWATGEYVGWHYKGKRNGFGIISVDELSSHPALDSLRNFGSKVDGRYFASGIFKNGEMIKHCVLESVCFAGFPSFDFTPVSDAIKYGASSLSLDEVRRLISMSVYRQRDVPSTQNECLIDELINENLGLGVARRSFEKKELTILLGRLNDKSTTTRAALYCS